MSLDISLYDKKTGEEVLEMNWLRNPFGLCDWAEDSVKEIVDSSKSLWYVCNHWNYNKSKFVKRALFQEVVEKYWEEIKKIEEGYFYFNAHAYDQFIGPKYDFFPKEDSIIGETRIKGVNRMGESKVGIPMQHFNHDGIIDLGIGLRGTQDVLEHYKKWFKDLVMFADMLQDTKYRFDCSN